MDIQIHGSLKKLYAIVADNAEILYFSNKICINDHLEELENNLVEKSDHLPIMDDWCARWRFIGTIKDTPYLVYVAMAENDYHYPKRD